jgi:uncharacterized protein with PIN domain
MDQDFFIEVVTFIVNNSYFGCNGKFYIQIDGLPMGLSLSPIAAQYVMEFVIYCVLNELGIDVELFVLYVDDSFLIIDEEEVEPTLMVFNNFDSNLKFTMEIETNKRLNFLDVLVERDDDGVITTSWYSKECASLRLLNFNSNQTLVQKLNIARNLIKRILDVSTDKRADNILPRVLKILMANGYPKGVIKSCFYGYLEGKNSNRILSERKYVSVTNVPVISSKLTKIMKKNNSNVCVALKNRKKVENLYSVIKDKNEKSQLSKLIYCIKCSKCLKKYKGLTFKQTLGTRSYQHENDCKAITKCAKECNVVGDNIKKNY